MKAKLSEMLLFKGRCDVSGGIALPGAQWVGADDEENTLRLYSTTGGAPADDAFLKLDDFLEIEGPDDEREADLESATTLGDLTFWIGSHSQSKKAHLRRNRHRLFATRVVASGGAAKIETLGKPCKTLRDALIADPQFKPFALDVAATIAPKKPGGFNLESICAEKGGARLWLGFRNPIPAAGALLVPLKNPREVVESEAAPAFDAPLPLDLGGLGFRDMMVFGDGYLILAGDFMDRNDAGAKPSQLYVWTGPGGTPERIVLDFGDFNPEALIAFPDGKVLVVSDDGARPNTSGVKCKDLPAGEGSFRAAWIEFTA
jgi:hypothetical protein